LQDSRGRARTQVCDSEPLILNGRINDHTIKATLGITAQSLDRDDIDQVDYDLDVGSS